MKLNPFKPKRLSEEEIRQAELQARIEQREVLGDYKDYDESGIGGVMPSDPIEDSVAKWEIETKEELERIENSFLGKEWFEGGWRTRKNSKAQISEEGIDSLMTPVRALVGKITTLSDLTQSEINKTCKEFRMDWAKKVAVNRVSWDIKKENRKTIVLTLDGTLHAALSKAKNAMMVKSRQKNIIEKRVLTNPGSRGRIRLPQV